MNPLLIASVGPALCLLAMLVGLFATRNWVDPDA